MAVEIEAFKWFLSVSGLIVFKINVRKRGCAVERATANAKSKLIKAYLAAQDPQRRSWQ